MMSNMDPCPLLEDSDDQEANGSSPENEEPPTTTQLDEQQATLEDSPIATPANNNSSSSNTSNNTNNNPWRNRNVILTLLWGVTAGVADSIWSNTVLSGFLLALAQAIHNGHADNNDNTLVGTAEAIQGIAMLVAALPVGIVADVFGKARVVGYGGVVFVVATGITLVALVKAKHAVGSTEEEETDNHAALDAYYWMLGALGLWGIGQGVIDGPAQALFADSIPKGQRSSLMMWLSLAYLLPSIVGPILGVVLLMNRKADESWSLAEIYPVFLIGVLLEIPGIIVMFFFSDKHTVVEVEEQQEAARNEAIESNPAPSTTESELEAPLLETESNNRGSVSNHQKMGKVAIPYVLFTASMVTSLGSGASVKYFPLFFRELGFSSAFVQGIYIFVPLSISLFSFLAQRASKKLGRIETTVLTEVFGVCLLYYMTWLSHDEADMTTFQKYQIIAVYIVRTGVMNACYPLLESVLMDALPSKKRARWKSLESIAAFGWTGSALVGGILADDRSYRYTFAITATMQLVGALLLIPLQPFVEPEETLDSDEESSGDAADASSPPSAEA